MAQSSRLLVCCQLISKFWLISPQRRERRVLDAHSRWKKGNDLYLLNTFSHRNRVKETWRSYHFSLLYKAVTLTYTRLIFFAVRKRRCKICRQFNFKIDCILTTPLLSFFYPGDCSIAIATWFVHILIFISIQWKYSSKSEWVTRMNLIQCPDLAV